MHFVNRAATTFRSFLDWCAIPSTANTLKEHACEWLTKKYLKLNWSGDGVFVPDTTGASQAHVREISFAEVMRWSLLPVGE